MQFSKLAALALAVTAAAPLVASAQPYDHPRHIRQIHEEGRIVSVQGSDFTLDNGTTVFLKPGTVINPTGRRFHPGQFVLVDGTPAGDHNLNARQIDIEGRHR